MPGSPGCWNAGDGVPYDSYCRATPPGVAGPHHPGRKYLTEEAYAAMIQKIKDNL